MPRFFIKHDDIGQSNTITLDGENARHISRSLRMRVGDRLVLCDDVGTEYQSVITGFTSDTVTLGIEEISPSKVEPSIRVTVYQALPKGPKLELIIQKCVELGAYSIVPVLTDRCIYRPDEHAVANKIGRWNAIAEEAAKQSGRGILPEVRKPISYEKALSEMAENDLSFLCYEDEDELHLTDFLKQHFDPARVSSIAFFVGPEGGISKDDAERAKNQGIAAVSLGKRILRTETAPLCALSGLMFLTDNM